MLAIRAAIAAPVRGPLARPCLRIRTPQPAAPEMRAVVARLSARDLVATSPALAGLA